MQFVPDYSVYSRSAEAIRSEFVGPLKSFSGPGWYRTENYTALVVPRPTEADATPSTVWDDRQPEGTLYDVHVWNSPMSALLLSVIAASPTRTAASSREGPDPKLAES